MFCLESTLRAAEAKAREYYAAAIAYKNAHEEQLKEWNKLVQKINDKGGEQFLKHGVINPPPQFSASEVKQLISLCHPDKHGNSSLSNEMTAKLNALREQA